MTDRRTIRLVIMSIAAVTLGALAGTYALAQRVLDQSAGTGSPDAAAVALVGVLGAVVTGGLGYLGGVLASTRSAPDRAEIEEALAPLTKPAPLDVNVAAATTATPVPTSDVDRDDETEIDTPPAAPALRQRLSP